MMTEIQRRTLTDGLIQVVTNPIFIQSVTRSLAGLIITIGMFVLLWNRVEIPQQGWWVILIGTAGTFGLDGILAFLNSKKS